MQQINGKKLQTLPNASMILVFGILSIAICSFIGLAFGIVALIIANKGEKTYSLNPGIYTKNSIGMLHAGKTCAIIGTILSAVATVIIILYFMFLGFIFTAIFTSNQYFLNY